MNVQLSNEALSQLETLRALYGLDGNVSEISQIVNGHINDTYHLDIGGKGYIFQRVNDYIFKQPAKIMNNIALVGAWLDGLNEKPECGILTFLRNRSGANYTVLPDGSFWRVSERVPDSVTYEMAGSAELLRGTGYAFGQFQRILSDMPTDGIEDTIPDFHNTKKRISDLFDTAALDRSHRADSVRGELDFFESNRGYFSKLDELRENGGLPLRIVHNDTKCNNILFSASTGRPVAVIDLDTIMLGLSAHDFGDAVRCAANFADEDETELSKVGLNMEFYKAFADGFMSAARPILTDAEVTYMALGAPTLAFELASRFLADHIDGDRYFRIHHENHNLERARCQIALCRDMMSRYDEMCAVIERFR